MCNSLLSYSKFPKQKSSGAEYMRSIKKQANKEVTCFAGLKTAVNIPANGRNSAK